LAPGASTGTNDPLHFSKTQVDFFVSFADDTFVGCTSQPWITGTIFISSLGTSSASGTFHFSCPSPVIDISGCFTF
jgi:hypothetical protein